MWWGPQEVQKKARPFGRAFLFQLIREDRAENYITASVLARALLWPPEACSRSSADWRSSAPPSELTDTNTPPWLMLLSDAVANLGLALDDPEIGVRVGEAARGLLPEAARRS